MMDLPPIAVLAGGLATRMRPMTETVPKSLLEVAGAPFVAHQLMLFKQRGLSRVVLCVGHMGEQIEAYVGDGSRFGLEVLYSHDGAVRMGTGGALVRALPLLGDEFFVTYGDSYLDVSYADVLAAFRRSGKPALMTVLHNDGAWDASNTEFSGGRIVAYSKSPTTHMKHIDFGLSLLRPAALSAAPRDEPFDLASVYTALVRAGEMQGYEVDRRFYEIGSPAGLSETDAYIRSRA